MTDLEDCASSFNKMLFCLAIQQLETSNYIVQQSQFIAFNNLILPHLAIFKIFFIGLTLFKLLQLLEEYCYYYCDLLFFCV